jgi:hypothetical protein
VFESHPLTTAEVAEFLERLPSLTVAVPDAERIDQLGLLESVKGACAAAQARAGVAFEESQLAAREGEGLPARERRRGLGAQVALARRDSPSRGSRHLGLAKALVHELPHTMAHLTAGRVSEWRATLVCRETACLRVEDRATVDRLLADDLPTMGDAQVQRRARAMACELDNAATAGRAARACTERRVTLRAAPDTMTWFTALLPVEQGVAVLAALTKAGDAPRREGDERTRNQVMADTLVERVTGRADAEAVPLEVHLVMPFDSMFARGDEPGAMGTQVVPADWANTVLGRVADRGAEVWLRRLFTTPDGADLVAMESARRRFAGMLRRFVVARDQVCRTPWCDAPVRHVDHVQPARAGGATKAANGQGLCEACNYGKEAPGWTERVLHAGPSPGAGAGAVGADPAIPHTVRITTPTGHTYDSTAPPVLPGRVRDRESRADLGTADPGNPGLGSVETAVTATADARCVDFSWLERFFAIELDAA